MAPIYPSRNNPASFATAIVSTASGVRSFIVTFDVYVVLNILEKYDNKKPDPICLDTYSRQMFKNLPDVDRVSLDKMMRDVIDWEATKDQLADIVANVFTKAELKASIAFMKTPLGASATTKSDALSTEFSTLVSQNLLKFMREDPVPPNSAVDPDVAR